MKDYFKNTIVDELDEQGRVKVAGHEWQNSSVFENMDPIAFEEHVQEAFLVKVAEAKGRARAFLEQTGSLENFELLCERVQRQTVMPFVGAGMSISSGFPLWGDFLLKLAKDSSDLQARCSDLMSEGKFEDAAQEVVDQIGEDAFANDIHAHLGRSRHDPSGPVRLLPYCFQRGCITTNLDEVLERVYRAQNLAFTNTPFGEQLKNLQGYIDPDHNNLFKIHGTAIQPHGRVLTHLEYQRAYANEISLSGSVNAAYGRQAPVVLGLQFEC